MYPGGIAIDHKDNIYVVDPNNDGIHKLSPQGKQLAVWATVGGDPGQFRFPLGVAIDFQDNLYVLDAGNNRIQELPAGH
jgi:DNA-binding beta-propeller fold protein YncE